MTKILILSIALYFIACKKEASSLEQVDKCTSIPTSPLGATYETKEIKSYQNYDYFVKYTYLVNCTTITEYIYTREEPCGEWTEIEDTRDYSENEFMANQCK